MRTIEFADGFSSSSAPTFTSVSFGSSSTQNPVKIFRDTTAGASTNVVELRIGNSGSNQGYVSFQYTNAAATGAPKATIAFIPRNNADSNSTNSANITIQKTAAADTASIQLLNTAGQIYLAASGKVGIGNASPSYTLDVTGDARFTSGILGNTTSASAGYLGEYTESRVTTPTNFPGATGAYGDGTSISLTAGVWEIGAIVDATLNGATMTTWSAGISTTSGNSGSGLQSGDNLLSFALPTSTYPCGGTVTGFKVVPSTTTTYYLKLNAAYSAGNPQYTCRLFAWRR